MYSTATKTMITTAYPRLVEAALHTASSPFSDFSSLPSLSWSSSSLPLQKQLTSVPSFPQVVPGLHNIPSCMEQVQDLKQQPYDSGDNDDNNDNDKDNH